MDMTRRQAMQFAGALGLSAGLGTRAGAAEDTAPQPLPRVAAFERMAFGMFVHWGLYSQLGRGEWVMHREKIPRKEYRKLRDTFDASAFDARALARLAKAAGMRYITMTARHHDGFSLYDTRGLTDWDAMHAAAGRDLVAEFVEGCRAEGIVPMLYHTTLDWYRPEFTSDFDAYLDDLLESVRVLCTHYGELGGLWFDGNWSRKEADWKEDRLYRMIRELQPDTMIINNTGTGNRGQLGHPEIDSTTYERGRPEPMDRRGLSKYVAAEMCDTLNQHWGYGANDFDYRSPGEVIENLCACRKAGANYLLNLGPNGAGAVPPYEAGCLRRVGEWVRIHAEAIYDGKPSEVRGEGDDFALEANGTTYLFVHGLGDSGEHADGSRLGPGPRRFEGLPRSAEQAVWLDNGEELRIRQRPGVPRLQATGYPYGTNTVVRVARVEVP